MNNFTNEFGVAFEQTYNPATLCLCSSRSISTKANSIVCNVYHCHDRWSLHITDGFSLEFNTPFQWTDQ